MDDRHYEITFDLMEAATERCFLVVVSDVTADRQREQFLEQGRERFVLFEHMQRDRGAVLDFIEDTKTIMGRIAVAHDLVDFARDVHTLKGNALSLGLDSLGRLCDSIEERLAEEAALPPAHELEPLSRRWGTLLADADRMLEVRNDRVALSSAQYRELERAAARAGDGGELARFVSSLKLESLSGRLELLAEQTRRIGARLEKPVTVGVFHDESRIDGRRWASVWAALVHPLRNAIDHGIENAQERAQAGKPECGRVALRTRTDATLHRGNRGA